MGWVFTGSVDVKTMNFVKYFQVVNLICRDLIAANEFLELLFYSLMIFTYE